MNMIKVAVRTAQLSPIHVPRQRVSPLQLWKRGTFQSPAGIVEAFFGYGL